MKENFHNGTCARVSRLFLLVLHRKDRATLQSVLENNSRAITEMAKVSRGDKKGASLSPLTPKEP